MECDSVHSAIERAKKNVSVYAPMDYVGIIWNARRRPPYRVHYLSTWDFLDFKYIMSEFIVNRNKSRQKENVNWLKIKRLCYTKASPGIIYYEYDYDEEFKEIIVNESGRKLRREHSRVMPELVPKLFKEAVPITNAKFADL